jgi:hypothetical protein
MELVYGVGVYERGVFVCSSEGNATKEYGLWVSMLARCYSTELQLKSPTYIDCEVSDDFKNFQYFAEWCNNQIGFGAKDYQLDKDLVFKGNKLYSSDTCFFVPKQVNMFPVKSDISRGIHPIGVTFDKNANKFNVRCKDGKGGGASLPWTL